MVPVAYPIALMKIALPIPNSTHSYAGATEFDAKLSLESIAVAFPAAQNDDDV